MNNSLNQLSSSLRKTLEMMADKSNISSEESLSQLHNMIPPNMIPPDMIPPNMIHPNMIQPNISQIFSDENLPISNDQHPTIQHPTTEELEKLFSIINPSSDDEKKKITKMLQNFERNYADILKELNGFR